MSYSNHLIPLSDIDCMTVIRALTIFEADEDVHELDKQIADRIREMIYDKVSEDKRIYSPRRCNRTYTVCADCKWLDTSVKKSIGYACANPKRIWKSRTAQWHSPSCKSCKCFELKEQRNEI